MFDNFWLDFSYYIIQWFLDLALLFFGYHIGKKSLENKMRWLELEKESCIKTIESLNFELSQEREKNR